MELLKFFESIRTPWLDAFFSIITHFGEETAFVLACFILLWCVNKRDGYYLLTVSFFGLLINQFLKIFCRIPRPWLRDESLTVVPSAVDEAVGYSFPSGHSQISVGTFGLTSRVCRSIAVKVISIILCVLVPLSRLYLGVHTLSDVLTSVVIALLLIFLVKPMAYKAFDTEWGMDRLFALMASLTAIYILYLFVYPFPADIDSANLESSMNFAFKMLGLTIGGWLGYAIDRKWVQFVTDASFGVQLIKVVFGFVGVLVIKEGLSHAFDAFGISQFVSDAIRYILISLFACGIWPMMFMYFIKKK